MELMQSTKKTRTFKATLTLIGLVVILSPIVLIGNNKDTVTVKSDPLYSEQVFNITNKINKADLIIIGTVSNTGSGELDDPKKSYSNLTMDEMNNIHHMVKIDIDKVLKGPEKTAVHVRVDTGKVGRYVKKQSSSPEYKEGQKVLVFLQKRKDTYHTLFGEHGYFSFEKQIIERNNAPPQFREKVNLTKLISKIEEKYKQT